MVVPIAIRREVRTVAIAVSVGMLVGIVVIGMGSRLAMRAIAATSDPALHGRLTSDQEPIGEITLDGTIGLILFVGVLGGFLLSIGYLCLRWLLPADLRWRAVCTAVVVWCMGAAFMFDSEDFDFRVLEPGWLAVLMFSAVFLASGWVVAAGIEVATRRWPSGRRGWWRFTPLVLLLPFFPLIGVAFLVVLVRSSSAVRSLASVRPLVLAGRVLLGTFSLALAVPAVGEIVSIV